MKKIKDIMSHEVDVIHPNASLIQAANKMKKHNVGVLPVCDGDRLKGMVTDRDIVVRALADRRDLERTRVSEVMSKGVYYCYEDEGIKDAAEIMQHKKVRRLLVLDRNKKLVRLLSLEDLAIEHRSGDVIRKTLREAHGSERSSFIGMSKGHRFGIGSIVLGSLFAGLGYYFMNQRQDVRGRLKEVIPFNKRQSQVA